MMWAGQIFLGILGMSAGVVVAGGLFSFIVELGVISDFQDPLERPQLPYC